MAEKLYEIIADVGHGTFGKVQKIKRTSDGRVLVWKELNYGIMSEKEKQQIVSEVNILRELNHPHIVQYFDRIIDKTSAKIFIIQEYCDGGDLQQLIRRCKKSQDNIDEEFIWKILAQTVSALFHCHRRKDTTQINNGMAKDGGDVASSKKELPQKILHRDLKPGNIFLDANSDVKLGDFGLARVMNSESVFARTHVGTPYYMSPEQIDEQSYNEKSDIWSLGCIIYELCALHPPFQAQNPMALATKIRQGKYERIPSQYSEELSRVIAWMLDRNTEKRASIDHLINLPIVSLRLREKRFEERQAFHYQLLKQKEQEIMKREERIAKRESVIEDKLKVFSEQERVLKEQEQLFKEKQEALAEREHEAALKEELLKRIENTQVETDKEAESKAKEFEARMEREISRLRSREEELELLIEAKVEERISELKHQWETARQKEERMRSQAKVTHFTANASEKAGDLSQMLKFCSNYSAEDPLDVSQKSIQNFLQLSGSQHSKAPRQPQEHSQQNSSRAHKSSSNHNSRAELQRPPYGAKDSFQQQAFDAGMPPSLYTSSTVQHSATKQPHKFHHNSSLRESPSHKFNPVPVSHHDKADPIGSRNKLQVERLSKERTVDQTGERTGSSSKYYQQEQMASLEERKIEMRLKKAEAEDSNPPASDVFSHKQHLLKNYNQLVANLHARQNSASKNPPKLDSFTIDEQAMPQAPQSTTNRGVPQDFFNGQQRVSSALKTQKLFLQKNQSMQVIPSATTPAAMADPFMKEAALFKVEQDSDDHRTNQTILSNLNMLDSQIQKSTARKPSDKVNDLKPQLSTRWDNLQMKLNKQEAPALPSGPSSSAAKRLAQKTTGRSSATKPAPGSSSQSRLEGSSGKQAAVSQYAQFLQMKQQASATQGNDSSRSIPSHNEAAQLLLAAQKQVPSSLRQQQQKYSSSGAAQYAQGMKQRPDSATRTTSLTNHHQQQQQLQQQQQQHHIKASQPASRPSSKPGGQLAAYISKQIERSQSKGSLKQPTPSSFLSRGAHTTSSAQLGLQLGGHGQSGHLPPGQMTARTPSSGANGGIPSPHQITSRGSGLPKSSRSGLMFFKEN